MPSLKVITLGLLFAVYGVLGVPTSPGPRCSVTPVLAQFDDITVNPAINLNPVPVPYKGLYYQAFDASQQTLDAGQPGVVPHSPPGYIYTQPTSETTAGTPMLSVNYPNSNVASFTPKSFYFDCIVREQALVGLPTSCLISLTGYKGYDNQVSNANQTCSQQFQYNPSTMTGQQQMAYSGLLNTCFEDISFAIITFNPPGGTAALAPTLSLQIDDFAYSYKTC